MGRSCASSRAWEGHRGEDVVYDALGRDPVSLRNHEHRPIWRPLNRLPGIADDGQLLHRTAIRSHHSDRVVFDEPAMAVGAALYAEVGLRLFGATRG